MSLLATPKLKIDVLSLAQALALAQDSSHSVGYDNVRWPKQEARANMDVL